MAGSLSILVPRPGTGGSVAGGVGHHPLDNTHYTAAGPRGSPTGAIRSLADA
ncbi:MAG: Cell division protein FtsI [Peptidoglycan synthetase] [uncultured Thermomicrobiales bacterium]|uniref:Cell division protein FtsI [Peptidoglycan synthetase] n=1 Tax=uncultured Thermomicrobiales bacterium TaxID=1645740 RepID=A0A6J4UNT1_9BACT|nr:MAG: Cell division protein FtsI [Peptidoglycan synthetase] [uncultured Thermomicrobiales bacterium]